ncbi:MAG: hypothetical protein J6M03_08490 [Clostridia bacterium]|nr:hypothetical protein [Clostridia bacterium]
MGKASKSFAGLAWGAALSGATMAGVKIVKEIKEDVTELEFISSDDKNSVKVESGSSSFAKDLTMFKITARREEREDECKFVFLSCSSEANYEWADDDHFTLIAGKGKLKQCCEISFSGEKILLVYYLKNEKNDAKYITIDLREGDKK